MKNFLSIDNLNIPSGESLKEVVQSSSEMEGCPITNILESEDKSIWLSTEELPQEITINLSKSLFKEYPEKISAIGIYCWHAYPTNPKLIEIQISKNKGESYISLGNFDLCLKPGRQLLQLEDDSEYILTNDISEKLILKLIIKETFGDKRTYINNIYLYDDINLAGKQLLSNMETIKEEDSNSLIYLRESRERTMPKSNLKEKANNTNDKNNNQNNLLEFNLEGNWFEDRCTSEYDNKKKKDYMLPNPNQWQYDTTYNELGQNWKKFPPTQKHFQNANDNFLNFNNMDYNMFVSTNKHAMDSRYRETFRTPLDMRDYYKNKAADLEEYRKKWTKKEQLFETTYNHDILSKIKNIIKVIFYLSK